MFARERIPIARRIGKLFLPKFGRRARPDAVHVASDGIGH